MSSKHFTLTTNYPAPKFSNEHSIEAAIINGHNRCYFMVIFPMRSNPFAVYELLPDGSYLLKGDTNRRSKAEKLLFDVAQTRS